MAPRLQSGALPALPAGARRLLEPRTFARVFAAGAAAAFLALGAVAFSEYSARAGVEDGAAPSAADGPLRVSGFVATIYVEAAGPTTVLKLRGAPGLQFTMPGDFSRNFAPGDFLTIEGVKTGDTVAIHAAVIGTHPLGAAGPALLVGAFIAAVLALDFLVPRAVGRGWTPAALARRLGATVRRRVPRRGPRDEGGQSTGDNHSGAPLPKG